MDSFIVYLLFSLGIVLIIKGGDWFVDAAIWIAEVTGIPKMIVGATIVSFATTLPELVVSASAVLKGSTGIAVGNAIGSTICNIGLITSIAYLFGSSEIDRKSFKRKGLLMMLNATMLIIFSINGVVGRLESIVLFSFILVFFYINLKGYQGKEAGQELKRPTRKDILIHVMKFVVGSVMVVLGSDLLVDNGIFIAEDFGVPESVIGLTMIALGTSLPELVTMVSSVMKKHGSIGLGNIIGANILNISLIIPVSSYLSKGGLILERTNFSLFGKSFIGGIQTMILDAPFSLALMAIMIIPGVLKGRVYKVQGALMLLFYISYVAILYGLY